MGAGGSSLPDENEPLNLRHFKVLRCIGRGAFGKVQLVKRRSNNKFFALKYISKEHVAKEENVNAVIEEYRILQHIDHPFIVNGVFAFQDEEYLFCGLELMEGGDLGFYKQTNGRVDEHTAKIWFLEILSGLRYLHGQLIAHRDIKPENVLIDSEGHANLADFNLVKHFKSKNHCSIGFCGTLAYVPPEILVGSPYQFQSDMWGLAVTMYEILEGHSPWEMCCNEADLLHNQSLGTPIMNRAVTDVNFEDLIMSMLVFDKRHRKGLRGAVNLTDNDPYFKDVCWDDVYNRRLISNAIISDVSFDPSLHIEEILFEEPSILDHDSRKAKSTYDFLEKDIELFKRFRNFDKEDAHEVALRELLRGLDFEEAERLREKMRDMKEENDASLAEIKKEQQAT